MNYLIFIYSFKYDIFFVNFEFFFISLLATTNFLLHSCIFFLHDTTRILQCPKFSELVNFFTNFLNSNGSNDDELFLISYLM